MIENIQTMVEAFESGRMTRRQLIGGLGALLMAATGAPAAAEPSPAPTFRSIGLNHVALSVTDVPRSRDFYVRHLGARVLRDGDRNCFLACGGNHFVALFRSAVAGLNHYCYTVEGYEAGRAVQTLKEAGLDAERHSNRVYFEDPDGITVQLSGEWDDYPGPRP